MNKPFDLTPPTPIQRAALEARLTPEQKEVLLHHGTEAPFCGGLLNEKQQGLYCCQLCGLPLFRSSTKFNSGTGWPSFFEAYGVGHIKEITDRSYGMIRTETTCGRCGSHQGHVFPDGPPPTGQRYCINSVSLLFVPEGQKLPDWLYRGEGIATSLQEQKP